MSDATGKVVRALFSYKPQNNDELAFKKGEEIQLTQIIEGGWWEGTLDGHTGWFPANYVKEIHTSEAKLSQKSELKSADAADYQSQVVRGILSAEREHIKDLNNSSSTVMKPLLADSSVCSLELSRLCSTYEEVSSVHQRLLAALEDQARLAQSDQRLGGAFINHVTVLNPLLETYCQQHAPAIHKLASARDTVDAILSTRLPPAPPVKSHQPPASWVELTRTLSLPFRQIERFPSLLKELERHIPESHVDRGNTQRAQAVYKTMLAELTDVRKAKELEVDILSSRIDGWEGESLSSLGEVRHVSRVQRVQKDGSRVDRIIILFSAEILILEHKPAFSRYFYEGRLPITGLQANEPGRDSDRNSTIIEVTGAMIESMLFVLRSRAELKFWLSELKPRAASEGRVAQVVRAASLKQACVHLLPKATIASDIPPPPPPHPSKLHSLRALKSWSGWCLRPSPPLNPVCSDNRKSISTPVIRGLRRKPDDPIIQEEDALLLRIVEDYCASAKARSTLNSYRESVREERLDSVTDRGLADVVFTMRDELHDLRRSHQQLQRDFYEQTAARLRLERRLQPFLNNNSKPL